MALADVPLETRVAGAVEAILSGAVAELAERYAIVACALWPPPDATVTNGGDGDGARSAADSGDVLDLVRVFDTRYYTSGRLET